MMLFWTLAIILGGVAAAFVILPLYFRRGQFAPDSRVKVNVSIYEERLTELQDSFESGDIDEDEFAHLKTELQKNLISDATEEQTVQEPTSGYRTVPLVLALLVPLFAFLAYSDWGFSWGAISDQQIASELKEKDPHNTDDMDGTVRRLAERLKSQPDNHQGWYLLGQSYMSMGLYEEAADTFKHLEKSFPQDAGLSSYLAQALYLADDRQYTPRVEKAVSRTLELDPENISMLEIRGMGEIQSGQPARALADFRAALAAGAEGRRAQAISNVIDSLESRLGIVSDETGSVAAGSEPNESGAAARVATAPEPVPRDEGGQRAIRVRVEVDKGLQLTGRERVFVFARAAQGPPMPLAVQEMDVSDLPRTVDLDESMAMMPSMGLDDFDQVQVVARISMSGIANVRPDDFQAVSESVDLTSANSMVTLRISERVGDL